MTQDTEIESPLAKTGFEKRQVFEQNLIVASVILQFSCAETSELRFSKCSVWWSQESVLPSLLLSGILLDVGIGMNFLFVPFMWKLEACLGRLGFHIFYIVKGFGPSGNIGACRRCLLVSNLKMFITFVLDCVLTYLAPH